MGSLVLVLVGEWDGLYRHGQAQIFFCGLVADVCVFLIFFMSKADENSCSILRLVNTLSSPTCLIMYHRAIRLGVSGASRYYADGTFGRGGHATEILRRLSGAGRLWAFDLDPNAVAVGQKLETGGDGWRRVETGGDGWRRVEMGGEGEAELGGLMEMGDGVGKEKGLVFSCVEEKYCENVVG